eukprot:GHUV01051090.1.p2 GENE.GHUV01051090.1~~GHUV01051090.1.p2  ORF type:complete len:102 (+),score=19.95 GHUV01051090.1:29-307(+)
MLDSTAPLSAGQPRMVLIRAPNAEVRTVFSAWAVYLQQHQRQVGKHNVTGGRSAVPCRQPCGRNKGGHVCYSSIWPLNNTRSRRQKGTTKAP